jgi:hypothetical protein
MIKMYNFVLNNFVNNEYLQHCRKTSIWKLNYDTCSSLAYTVILACEVLGMTNSNGSGSDDWIYWPFFVQLHLIINHRARSLIYTFSSGIKSKRTHPVSLRWKLILWSHLFPLSKIVPSIYIIWKKFVSIFSYSASSATCYIPRPSSFDFMPIILGELFKRISRNSRISFIHACIVICICGAGYESLQHENKGNVEDE